MITAKLGFHISDAGGRVAVVRRDQGSRRARGVGFLAEDKKSVLDARGAVVGRVRHGDALVKS